ncbi:bifunctional metallophosphatase/5'-nucleotidase [Bradyrhizobium sp. ISRA443]|uniref:bifunctional metallophosphatase/5'-nucleotidase n=1 Tax=unclassified Bradyrhizobium TaxID=2631580 RepID=UPI00247A3A69|nr:MULTISPECIES: bifunctional metallophosphatase/5'-nucleotidase [unclassified Bradyrhizobium]WGR91046.1 bifunctional metallophosphatase/5'-nucleotidase [Bradyrhizobium sp. ISRA435]WGS01210.1 bifunctional metallophosphatase/5'-nucleotidase [Bradyrhizobium sp. ISRA436]WGS08097.1 bifunctional metallophosphatase/5'-nucleotidase [Bradyrhizobium sp. ISRA437]WGS14985.1 bifunctional metallophosphatase/5'-nucleotidase [Bradyrhizobium sp. ISRA443]
MRRSRRSLLTAAVCSFVAVAAGPAPAQTAAPVDLRILAINDFHGYLRPPPGGIRITDPADNSKKIMVPAGGAERMATAVKQLREGHKNNIFVAAGDLIGASPFLSAMFHDEPTIESLSMMGLAISSVGNHEFDEGKAELLRMQNGGCHPVDQCQGPHPFTGAKFHYLAASTIDKTTGKPVFPPYEIREFGGIPVAFIGLTLKNTPNLVSPAGVASLEFRDEAETVNALVPELKAKGVEAIVVLIHEGGFPTGDYNECPGISGPIVDIVKKIDHAVDVVISGHTHQAYICEIDGRLVTSGDKYGTLVTAIDLQLDPKTHDVISAKANNTIVRLNAFKRDPEQSALLEAYDRLAAPIANRAAGAVTETLSRTPNDAGESPLGDIVADAQLLATSAEPNGGAVIAFTNPGGVRTDITMREDGAVSYADIFASQPFRNQLVTMTLTGRQLKDVLEQQWADPKRPRPLQVSKGFSYAWDATRPDGARIIAERMSLNGKLIDPAASYRVTVNDYLAEGGDGFTVFKDGTAQQFGVYDVDALYAYFKANSPVGPTAGHRIERIN